MAVTNNKRISELNGASQVSKEDLLVIVQNGETKNAPKRLVSEENYTSTEKTKLAGIEAGANRYVLPDDVVHDNDIADVVRSDSLEQTLRSYSLVTETGNQVELVLNESTYEMTVKLLDKNGRTIHTSNKIDLPLETMVVNAEYDKAKKEIKLTLQNGNTVSFSVADLVSGLVSETQLATALEAYAKTTYVDGEISKVNVTISSLSKKVDDLIIIGSEEDVTDDTEIFIDDDQVNTMGTEVVDSLDGNETIMAPSVRAVNKGLEDLNTYSTNEQVIGKWIDGKPIYKKTYNGITTFDLDSSSQLLIPASVNVDKIINCSGYVTELNGRNVLTTDEVRIVKVDSNKVLFQSANNNLKNSPYAITFEYTKTTD